MKKTFDCYTEKKKQRYTGVAENKFQTKIALIHAALLIESNNIFNKIKELNTEQILKG